MLGKKVFNDFKNYQKYELHTITRSANPDSLNHHICDLKDSNELQVIINTINPDVAINCSGITNLRLCEEDKKYAHQVHVESTSVITKCINKDCYYLHISTDSVFDGKNGEYTETDRPYPLNYYAQSKLDGDKVAMANHENTLILRVNIFGVNSPGGNSLMEWGIKNFLKKENIVGYDNVFFNPLYAGQLSKLILYLMDNRQFDIFNIGCKERYSKYLFLKEVLYLVGGDDNLLKKASYSTDGQKIKRPLNTTLNLTRLSSFYEVPLITDGIKEAIADFLKSN